jgi:hypothetical protein
MVEKLQSCLFENIGFLDSVFFSKVVYIFRFWRPRYLFAVCMVSNAIAGTGFGT